MIDQKELVLTFDGGIWPNPGGVPRFGWQVKDKNNNLVCEGKGSDPNSEVKTNNVAEYLGLIKGLSYLKDNEWSGSLTIRSDSKLLVEQMTDRFVTRKPHLIVLRDLARKILHQVTTEISIEWVSRDKNSICDKLASGK